MLTKLLREVNNSEVGRGEKESSIGHDKRGNFIFNFIHFGVTCITLKNTHTHTYTHTHTHIHIFNP